MFAPAYLVTPSVVYPLPTANYPQHYVRASAAWQSLCQHNLYWLERIGNAVTECPVLALRRTGQRFRVIFEMPDGSRQRRVVSASKYLFIREAVIVQIQTLLMLMLALFVMPLLAGPPALPMLPPPRPAGLLPARAESACVERQPPPHHMVWVTVAKPQNNVLAAHDAATERIRALNATAYQRIMHVVEKRRVGFKPRPLFE